LAKKEKDRIEQIVLKLSILAFVIVVVAALISAVLQNGATSQGFSGRRALLRLLGVTN